MNRKRGLRFLGVVLFSSLLFFSLTLSFNHASADQTESNLKFVEFYGQY